MERHVEFNVFKQSMAYTMTIYRKRYMIYESMYFDFNYIDPYRVLFTSTSSVIFGQN